MQVRYGYAGRILFVDLTSGKIEKKPLTEEDARTWLGGAGINTKLLFELTRPGIDPLSPENVLIFGAGPFIGTNLAAACKTVATAKSPVTNAYGTNTAGGFGSMFKYAGYDHIVFTGRAERPVWLRIMDDDVALVNAEHMWGKDIFETTDIIWQDYPESWVAAIGQAGEHMSNQANIIFNKFGAFGLTGLGAVMGSKRLKAIGVYGTKSVRVANPAGFLKTAAKMQDELLRGPYVKQWRELGTLIQFQDYAPGASDQMKSMGFNMNDFTANYTSKLWQGTATCPACPVGCKARLEVNEGKYQGLDMVVSCPAGTLTSPFAMTLQIPVDQWDGVAKCAEMSNRWGLGTLGISPILAFAFDLWDQGVINIDHTDGLELKRGDPDCILELMRQMTYREGFGGLLAERFEKIRNDIEGAEEYCLPIKGWYYASKPLKKGSGQPRVTKGEEKRRANWQRKWDTISFGMQVSPRGPQFNYYSSITMMPGRSPESLRRYCERIGVPPEEIDQIVTGEVDGYDVPAITKYVEIYNMLIHCLGECQRPFVSRALNMDTIVRLYSTCTGIALSCKELQQIAERIVTLQKVYNLDEGLTKKDDLFPENYLPEGCESEERNLEEMLDKYYKFHGWKEETGEPSPEVLAELCLDRIVQQRHQEAGVK